MINKILFFRKGPTPFYFLYMDIFNVIILILLAEVIFFPINKGYSLIAVIVILLLVPGILKFNIGVNLNVFNVSISIFCGLLFFYCRHQQVQFRVVHQMVKGYWAYIIISAFLASFGDISIGEYLKNMLLFSIEYTMLAYTMCYIRLDAKAIKVMDTSLVACAFIIIVYGLFNYFTASNPYIAYISLLTENFDMSNVFQEESRGIITGRISSTFIHPLQLGQASLLLLCYVLYQFEHRSRIFLFWSLTIGLILMCVLCGSRSAVVPVIVAVVIYIYHKKLSYMVSSIFVGVALLFFCYPMLPKDAKTTVEGFVFFWNDKAANKAGISGSSVDGRTEQLSYAFKAIDNRLLIGYGEGHVRNYGDTHPGMLGYESVILRQLVDGGLLGTLVFFCFYIFLYKALLAKCHNQKDKGRVHVLCFPFLISLCLTGVSYSFFTLYMMFYFLTLHNITNNNEQRFYIENNRTHHP